MRAPLAVLLVLAILGSQELEAQSRRRSVARKSFIPIIVSDDFRNGALGWTAGFADFAPVTAPTMELDSGIRPLPAELGMAGTGFWITGHNRSDDLFMFLSKKLTAADGVLPRQRYQIRFKITAASSAGSNCIGVGGAPGESVYLKVGATNSAPAIVLNGDLYQVNFDKGQQSQGGAAASVAGHIGNGSSNCSDNAPFIGLAWQHTHPDLVTSTELGELWLVVGTDSAFEGKTTLYYQAIEATLTPVN